MITLLDRLVIDAGCSAGWSYKDKLQRKHNAQNALKSFAKSSNLACVSMPKKGNGTNITIGKVNVRIGANYYTITTETKVGTFTYTSLTLSQWSLQTLVLDEVNQLLILNDKIAFQYN